MANVKRNQKALARDQFSSVHTGRAVALLGVLAALSAVTKAAESRARSKDFDAITATFKHTTELVRHHLKLTFSYFQLKQGKANETSTSASCG